jgi:recombination protein RecT
MMAKTQVAHRDSGLEPIGIGESMQNALHLAAPALQRASPKVIEVGRLVQTTSRALKSTPRLADCTRRSVLGCLFESAKLGLYPDQRGLVWWIPRQTGPSREWEAQFQLGYQGYRELAHRTGKIDFIESRTVREEDHFEYQYGTDAFVDHKPYRKGHGGDLVATYGIAWIKGSERPLFVVLERWKVEEIKAACIPEKLAKSKSSAWVQWEEEMWAKLPVMRVCKQLPFSTELERSVSLDEIAIAGKSQRLDVDFVEETGYDFTKSDKSQLDEILPEEKGGDKKSSN